jgi:hypothetical protein
VCQTCFHEQVCPENINFDAGSDFDSDMAYRRSETEKANQYLKDLSCKGCTPLDKTNTAGWFKETPAQLGYYWFFGYIKTENGHLRIATHKDGTPKIQIGKISSIQESSNGDILITYLISNDVLYIRTPNDNVFYWKKIEPPTTDGLEFNFGSD